MNDCTSPSARMTRSSSACLLLLLLSLSWLASASADTDKTLFKTCRGVTCPVQDHELPDAGSKNIKWLIAGLPHIFWAAVADGDLFRNRSLIHAGCLRQLQHISDALSSNENWAFQFPDSSGKASPGFLQSTLTSYGDYDQCLSIDENGIHGKYCMLDMYHLGSRNRAYGKLSLDKVSLWMGFPQFSSLCLPNACDGDEIQHALKILLEPHLIKVAGVVHCDTRESTRYTNKLSRVTFVQIASIAIVVGLISLVLISTLYDLFARSKSSAPSFLKSMSIMKSCENLFYAPPWTFEILIFDMLKSNIIILGTVTHIMLDFEVMLFPVTQSNQREQHNTILPVLQNDTGLLGLPFLTGIAAFASLYPRARSNKLSYMSAVINRILRILPALIVVTACEFIWPLLGSGPLYTRVGDFIIDHCGRNWMYNLFFVNNFLYPTEICGFQSYWSSVDMQLFLLGITAVFIFVRSEKLGVSFCVLMMSFGSLKTAYNAASNDTGFSLINYEPDMHRFNEYFHNIHMKTTSYMTSYFAGIVVSFMRSTGRLMPKLESGPRKIAFFGLTWAAFLAVNYNCSLVQKYPYHMRWLFISINRSLQLLGNVLMFMFLMSFKGYWDHNWGKDYMKHGVTFSPFKALCRLCFPLYLCNFLYARTEFYTRRFLSPSNGFWMLRNTISSTIFLYVFTIMFHVFLIAPIDVLIQRLMKSQRSSDKKHA